MGAKTNYNTATPQLFVVWRLLILTTQVSMNYKRGILNNYNNIPILYLHKQVYTLPIIFCIPVTCDLYNLQVYNEFEVTGMMETLKDY